jgi:hypothetical protein
MVTVDNLKIETIFSKLWLLNSVRSFYMPEGGKNERGDCEVFYRWERADQ